MVAPPRTERPLRSVFMWSMQKWCWCLVVEMFLSVLAKLTPDEKVLGINGVALDQQAPSAILPNISLTTVWYWVMLKVFNAFLRVCTQSTEWTVPSIILIIISAID